MLTQKQVDEPIRFMPLTMVKTCLCLSESSADLNVHYKLTLEEYSTL